MGLAQLLPRTQLRAVKDPAWNRWANGDDIGFGGTSDAGVRVTRESALQLMTVFGCQSLIADSIAMMPRDVYRKTGGQRQEVDAPFWLSQQANADNTPRELVLQIVLSLLGDGNAFLPVIRDRKAQVAEVWCLDPLRVNVIRDQRGNRVYLVDGSEYRGELIHLTWFLLPGAIRALNPIQVAREAIGLGAAAQSFGGKFFANGSRPAIVINHPGDPSDEQLKVMAASFRRAHTGQNAMMPAVVTGGGSVTPITITPDEAQFLETRAYSAAEIAAQLYKVNPSRLGIVQQGSSLTYQNVEQRGIELVRDTLLPWMSRVEECFSYLLPRPQYMRFNADVFLRADLKARYDAYAVGIQNQFLVPNEARRLEDLDPIAGGDTVVAKAQQQQLSFGGTP